MDKKRIALWDNVEFLLILTVVLGHFAEPFVSKYHSLKWLFLFIYSFHMPLLIYVSGVFHKDKDIGKKALFYILLYVIAKAATYCAAILTGAKPTFSLFAESGFPWLFLALGVYAVFTYCLRKVNKIFLAVFFMAAACAAGYNKSIGDFLVLSRIIVFYPFYLAGAVTPREKLEKLASLRRVKIAALVTFIGAGLLFYIKLDSLYVLRHLFTGRNPYNDSVVSSGYLYRLICYGISCVIGLAFILAAPTQKHFLLTDFGSKTLQIYFWHNHFRRFLQYFKVSNTLLGLAIAGRVAWLAIGCIIAYCCSAKVFAFPTGTLHRLIFSDSGAKLRLSSPAEWYRAAHKAIMNLIRKVKKSKFLFEELVKRDFKQKYKGTFLGMWWSVLSPLLSLLVMKMVFTEFFGRNTPHFTTYMFCGNLLYTYYKESTKGGMNALIANRSIILKVNVPKYMFLLSKNVSALINFGLTLILLFLFAVIDRITFGWHFISLLYPVVCLIVFNIGMGLILSALYVFFRDIGYLYDIFTLLLMYCSAIFYQVDRYPAAVQRLFLFNPVYCYIKYFRVVMIDGSIPGAAYHLLCAFYALTVLICGGLIYKKYNHQFLYYM